MMMMMMINCCNTISMSCRRVLFRILSAKSLRGTTPRRVLRASLTALLDKYRIY